MSVLNAVAVACYAGWLARSSRSTLVVFLPARRYASASTSCGPVSVRPSVSVTVGVLSKLVDGSNWRGGFFRPVPRCVVRTVRYLDKQGYMYTALQNSTLS